MPLAMKEFFLSGFCFRGRDGRTLTLSPSANPQTFSIQREKFKKEALRLGGLQSRHVVHVHDMFEENGTVYYVMDYVQGESLADLLESTRTPFQESQVLGFMRQILDALEEIHRKHIWHLDLKPDNVMLDLNTGNVVVIDFGASKQLGQQGHYTGTTGVLCYTPGFAPLEQVSQDLASVGPWTDFYALGATAYNLLTNEMPPSFTQLQEKKAVKFPASVSKQTRALILWLMSPNRMDRPQSVADIWRSNLLVNYKVNGNVSGKIKQKNVSGNKQAGNVSGHNQMGAISGRPVQQNSHLSGRSGSKQPAVKKPWSNKTALIVLFAIIGVLFILVVLLGMSGRGEYNDW